MRAIDKKARKNRKANKSRAFPKKNKLRKKRAAMRTKELRAKVKAQKKKAAGETLIAFLLDESGSMKSRREVSIDGANAYIDTVKADKKSKYRLWLRTFSTDRVRDIHRNLPLDAIANIGQSYLPNGGTPLYDAIGDFTTEIENAKHQGNILMVILTDGEENSSHRYDSAKTKALIQAKQAAGWNFIYLGANQDAWLSGSRIGIAIGSSLTYNENSLSSAYLVAATATVNNAAVTSGQRMYRSNTLEATIDWKNEAKEKIKDYIKPPDDGTGCCDIP